MLKNNFAKFWASFTALVILVVGTEVGTDSKWYTYSVAALGTAAVWFFKNTPAENKA